MKINILIASLLVSPLVFAMNTLQHEKSKLLAKELASTIDQSLLAIEAYENEVGNKNVESGLIISNQDLIEPKLGLLIDRNTEMVLGVSPKLIADEMGVLVGDKINHIQVDQEKISVFDKTLPSTLATGDEFAIDLQRNGQTMVLNKKISHGAVPKWQLSVAGAGAGQGIVKQNSQGQCGFISQFFTPPVTKQLYPAAVSKIDGEQVARPRNHYKVEPGLRKIKVFEGIDDFSLKRFETRKSLYEGKFIEIDVEANVDYEIAARYIKRHERREADNKDYWEPVVWKKSKRNCKL